jgi:HK97 family phage portal protein
MLGLDNSALDRTRDEMLTRDVEPLEGTNISLFDSIIPFWWTENGLTPSSQWMPGNGILAERVWVANRCIQMNAQQISSMPLKFEAPNVQAGGQPSWVSSPDPEWFPNGIGDAIFSIVSNMYGWGYAILQITDTYSDGYPRSWTVLPSAQTTVELKDGRRAYRLGEMRLDPASIVQIDRNPGGLKGCSALRAYAQQCWSMLAAGNQQMSVSQGGIPTAVLKSQRKLTAEQAEKVQTQWMTAVERRNGAPPVLPPELDFTPLSFNPQELGLLDVQDYDARAIMTAFGVPAVLMNTAIRWGMTYQNPAALGEMWWRFELRTTAKRIADSLTAQMLPAGQYVWVDPTDTFLPLSTPAAGPFASSDDDTEAAADPQAVPSTAPASGAATLAAVPSPSAIASGGYA